MSNFQKKSENFEKSVARLQEALEEYDLNKGPLFEMVRFKGLSSP